MKLLTFLGTANYQVTTYTLGEQRYCTCYCPGDRFPASRRLVVDGQGRPVVPLGWLQVTIEQV